MKYQSQHDLLDPDVPPPETATDADGEQDAGAPGDAYVIGEHGRTVQAPDVKATTKRKRDAKQWVQPVGALLSAVFVALTVWNLSRLLGDPPPPPKLSPYQVKQALYLGVMKIDAYRRVHAITPGSLAEAGLLEAEGYGYTRIDPTRYVVSFQGNGPRLEYDSIVPKDRFFGSPQEILTMGASQ